MDGWLRITRLNCQKRAGNRGIWLTLSGIDNLHFLVTFWDKRTAEACDNPEIIILTWAGSGRHMVKKSHVGIVNSNTRVVNGNKTSHVGIFITNIFVGNENKNPHVGIINTIYK